MLEMEVKRLKVEIFRYRQGNIPDNQPNPSHTTARSMSPSRPRTAGYASIDYDLYSGHKIVRKKIITNNITTNSNRPTTSTKFIALSIINIY